MIDHDTVSREQSIKTAAIFAAECQKPEPGNYKLYDLGKLLIDCADTSLVEDTIQHTAMMFSKPLRPQMSPVRDPIRDGIP